MGYPPGAGYPAPYGYPPGSGYPPAVGYGPPPPWGPSPQAPRRPGQVITSAVLAFVQALFVLLASLYLWFFASVAEIAIAEAAADTGATYSSSTVEALAAEGTVLAAVQLGTAVFLVGAGVVALTRRTRAAWLLLLVAHAVQVALALYWGFRLLDVMGDIPGAGGEEAFAAFALFFAAAPLVGAGLLAAGPGRRWFGGGSPA
jgi:hypothetical protein